MNQFLKNVLTCGLVVVASLALFAGGAATGYAVAQLEDFRLGGVSGASPAGSGTPAELQTTFAPFWQAWRIVHDNYYEQPLDDTQLMRGAIRGMMESLGDPATSYLSPEEYAIFSTTLTGDFEGIGAYVEMSGDYLRIVSPIPGSPAEAEGILPGDLIVRVDDEDIAGQSEVEIISKVRGPAGTTVHLTIQREGHTDLLEFDVTRAKIVIPSVESELLDGGIAYVKINDFGARTPDEFRDALKTLLADKPTGLILDLRGNPGGYLDTAVAVASQFLEPGANELVLRERFGDGREETYSVRSGGLATNIPLVVLIDKGSASASEIVAGAIQDHGRGTLVGETSYGKGSVQTTHTLDDDNGEVKVTIARWLTPSGRSIHQLGITPDVEVLLTEDDRAADLDPQLDKAIEILGGGAYVVPLEVFLLRVSVE
jgi:carboxyl-terminal processing protease